MTWRANEKVPEATARRIAELHRDEGLGLAVLAKRFRLHHNTIAKVLRRAGVERPAKRRQRSLIVNLYAERRPLHEIASICGIKERSVRASLRRAGMALFPFRRCPRIPEQERRRMLFLYRSGCSIPALAQLFGRSYAGIKSLLQRASAWDAGRHQWARLTNEKRARVLALYGRTSNISAVARSTGHARETVREVLRCAGVVVS